MDTTHSPAKNLDEPAPPTPGADAPHDHPHSYAVAARWILGVIFIVSALFKAADIGAFAEEVAHYGVVSAGPASNVSAFGVVALELALGVALLARWWPRRVLTVTLVVLGVFTALVAYAWAYRGLAECGCFGDFIPMTPAASIAKNLVLIALVPIAWRGTRTIVPGLSVSSDAVLSTHSTSRIRRRAFWTGLGIGAVSAFIGLIVAGYAASYLLRPYIAKRAEARLRAPLLPGTKVDYAWNIRALDGTVLSMESFRGKPVFICLFRSQCPSCRATLPSIQRLYSKAADAGVEFLCISKDTPERISQYMAEHQYTFPAFTFEKEQPAIFKTATPTVYILSPEGEVVLEEVTSLDWDTDACLSFLRNLSNKEATPPPEAEPSSLQPTVSSLQTRD